MSNYLAVATVTATLQRELQSAIGVDVPGATATTVRPDAPGHGVPEVGVNIFLYEVAPNAAVRNRDLPARSGNGQTAVQRPALGAQRVLGSVVRHLHSQPLLTRKMIQDAVQAHSFLANSNLADAVDFVRFSPLSLSLEELSKLWSVFFQTAYVLSAAYRASLVFIEEELTPVTALPVRERQVFVVPFQQPFIENVDPQIIASGAILTIRGQNLRGDETKLKFGDTLVTPASADITNAQIKVALPPALQPGVRTAQVIHDFKFGTTQDHRGFESNVAPFILQPKITTALPITIAHGGTLTLDLAPPIGRKQSVALLLNSNANNYSIPSKKPLSDPATSIDFEIPASAVAGDYFARVRVDGAESALDVDSNTLEYTGPKVTIT